METIECDERGLLQSCPQCAQRNRMNYERLGQTFRCGQCHTELPRPGQPIELKKEDVFHALIGRAALPVVQTFGHPGVDLVKW